MRDIFVSTLLPVFFSAALMVIGYQLGWAKREWEETGTLDGSSLLRRFIASSRLGLRDAIWCFIVVMLLSSWYTESDKAKSRNAMLALEADFCKALAHFYEPIVREHEPHRIQVVMPFPDRRPKEAE